MNCRDMDKLLSSYANNELDSTQVELVKEHLASCVRCQERLKQFIESGQHIMSLKQTPPLPDMKPSIMSRISIPDVRARSRKQLRLALIALPIASIVITLLILQFLGFFTNPLNIVSKAYAATQISTFHSLQKMEMSYQDSGVSSISYQEMDYDGPERYHLKLYSIGQFPWQIEVTSFNSHTYFCVDFSSLPANPAFEELMSDSIAQLVKNAPQIFSASAVSQMANTDDMFNYLTNVKKLDDEKLDGVTCLRYQAMPDWEKLIAKFEEIINQKPSSLSQKQRDIFQSSIDLLRNSETEALFEFWISKNDYLLRQIIYTSKMRYTQNLPTGTRMVESSGVVSANYNYNEPVIIQSPLTTNGELLPGWQIYSGTSE